MVTVQDRNAVQGDYTLALWVQQTDVSMIFIFDNHELDTDQRELRTDGEAVAIEPKTYLLLLLLAENPHRVVSKDEIAERVWDGRFVSDGAITTCIKLVRRALGDSGREQRYVKTVHGQGVRFIADVDLTQSANPISSVATEKLEHISADGDSNQSVLLRPSIAVLPFNSLSADPSHVAVTNSINADIHASISKLRWLMVIARGSTNRFLHASENASGIGKVLGVRYVVDGDVSVFEQQFTLTLEVSDAQLSTVIWSDRFSGNLDRVHELRDSAVGKLLSALEIEITLYESRRAKQYAPENLDAWSAYHLGVQAMYRFNKQDTLQAVRYLQRAVELEPEYARAYAALSFAHFQSVFNRYDDDPKHQAKLTAEFADKALALDPLDPFINFCKGRSYWLFDSIDQSMPWLDRAVLYNPSFAQGYYARSLAALMIGEDRDSGLDSLTACTLSPFDPFMYGFLGIRVFDAIKTGDHESALYWAERAANAPGALVVMDMMALSASTLAGDHEKAAYWLQRLQARDPQASQQQFFAALPFTDGAIRQKISAALASHRL